MKNFYILVVLFGMVFVSCGPAGDDDGSGPGIIRPQSYAPGETGFYQLRTICETFRTKVGLASSQYNSGSFSGMRLYNYLIGSCGETAAFSSIVERFYHRGEFELKVCDTSGNNCNSELRMDFLEDLYVNEHRFFKPFCSKVLSNNEAENTLRNEEGELLQISFAAAANQFAVNINVLNEASNNVSSQYRFLFRSNRTGNDHGYLLDLSRLNNCGGSNFETTRITLR